MARRFLILHGIENRRPPEHWERRLADRLRDSGEQVIYPPLPVPEAPRWDDWADVLHTELSMLGDGERIVVGHSLGCTLWLGAAPQPPVDRVLLVAPPGRREIVRLAPSFAAHRPDPDAVRAGAREITFVTSDRDPYNAEDDIAALAAAAGAHRHVIAGAGHISVDDGYGQWPGVEAWCLDPATAAF